ncbi:unnamed protein product [Pedinophyceae sp. YPF-701]|nr:unnamed protein product [Pedinophyceae sp. YPF-701]
MASKLEEQATGKGQYSYSSWAQGVSTSATPQPVRLDATDANATQPPAAGSAWNSAGTFEQRDLSAWAYEEVRARLPGLESGTGGWSLKVTAVKSVDGDACINFVRGQKRCGFDLNVECEVAAAKAGRPDQRGKVQVQADSADLEDIEVAASGWGPAQGAEGATDADRREASKAALALRAKFAEAFEELLAALKSK